MCKAFDESRRWLDRRGAARMVAVQAEVGAPIVRAWNASTSAQFFPKAATVASGLRVPDR